MAEAQVLIKFRYGTPVVNGINGDITAAQAAAGVVQTWFSTIFNQSNIIRSQVKAWLHPDTLYYEISADGISYSSPKAEANAIDLPDVPSQGRITLYFRRTIPAGIASAAKVEVGVYLKSEGL